MSADPAAAPTLPGILAGRSAQAFPVLTPAQLARIERHGTRAKTQRGEILVEPGERHRNLFVVLAGSVEVVRPGMGGEELVALHVPGQFSGEMNTEERRVGK